jgi:hypothetical protein
MVRDQMTVYLIVVVKQEIPIRVSVMRVMIIQIPQNVLNAMGAELKFKDMENLKSLKSVQVLTDGSIFQIKVAIGFLEVFNERVENKLVKDNIAKLKELLNEVTN